jgi:hypothetical protein
VENSIVRNLIYNEKINASLSVSMLANNSNVFQYGTGIQPTSIEYNEEPSVSLAVYLYKLNKSISFGVKGQFLKSSTTIGLDNYEHVSIIDNPIQNNENTYIRKNLITDFSETLTLEQKKLFIVVNYSVDRVPGLTLFGGINIYTDNILKSERSASAKYSGVFEDFNVEIDEPINYTIDGVENTLDLGYKEWNIKEDIELTQTPGSVYEIGASYNLPQLSWLNIFAMYESSSENMFDNSSDQISKDINEFNSFVSFSEYLLVNGKLSAGVSFSFKF